MGNKRRISSELIESTLPRDNAEVAQLEIQVVRGSRPPKKLASYHNPDQDFPSQIYLRKRR